MISHLFFDLDGTITDPREGIVRSIAHALTVMERPVSDDDVLQGFIGPPLARTFATLLGSADAGFVSSAISAYRERFASIGIFENRVYPDIPPALSALIGRGFTLSLVTSKPTIFARRILEHFGLAHCFRAVYGPDLSELHYTKGSLIERALAGQTVSSEATVMIGDRGEDIEGARANAVRSVGVTWGYGSREELERAGASHIVRCVPELIDLHILRRTNNGQERRRGHHLRPLA